jgi:ankyrin repeat protein
MARLLLDHGVDANVQKDNLWTSLHVAWAHDHLKVAQMLVQSGARLDMLNGMQETPLHLAAGNGRVEISCLLIDCGANLCTINKNGWTALHTALRQRRELKVVNLLLLRDADADALNKLNKTPAALASENDEAEVTRFIAEYNADPNIRNKIRSTTLDTDLYANDEDEKYCMRESLCCSLPQKRGTSTSRSR